MRDLSISIEGSWWDTLLYKGKLHGFTPEGDWAIYDWDAITSDLEASVEAAARPALHFSFRASNAIKSGALSREAVAESFERVPNQEYSISAKQLGSYLITKSDASAAFPSTSMNMHYDRMIVSSQNGVHVEYVTSEAPGNHSLKKLSSVATRQIAPAYGKVACASGDAGLRQLDLHLEEGFKPKESDGEELNEESCDACDWMYQNISALSYNGSSFLARFKRTGKSFHPSVEAATADEADGNEVEELEFEGNSDLSAGIVDEETDTARTISWGSHDKIYRVSGNKLKAFRFLASGQRPMLGDVLLPGDAREIVSVRSALFGVVIEFDEAVVVIKGDGTRIDLDGEPVNISSFARSRRYENQLHLITEERIHVMSFNLGFDEEGFYEKKFGSKAPSDWFG